MELTRYMNPLKAYVYLSWNLPVVATAVANVDAVPGLVHVAAGHEPFLEQVARTLDVPRPPRTAFREHVMANDWPARLSGVVNDRDLEALRARDYDRPRPCQGGCRGRKSGVEGSWVAVRVCAGGARNRT